MAAIAPAAERGLARVIRHPVSPALLAVLLCLPALRPLLLPGFIEGHDGIEHAFRVLALATAWRESAVVGNVLPRWIPNLALGFGYPFFGLYSPLAYVFPAALTLLGMTPILAVKLAVGLALLLAGLGAFLAARSLAGATVGIVAAVTYVYAPYTLANAYVRLDLAELSAMACAALALAALVHLAGPAPIACATRRRVVLAALALAAVPLCHNLSAFTFFPLFGFAWLALVVGSFRRGFSSASSTRLNVVLPPFFTLSRQGSDTAVLGGMGPLLAAPILALALAAFFLLPAWRWQGDTHLAAIPNDPAFYVKLLHPLALLQRRFAVPGWGWFGNGSAWWNFSVAPSALGEFGAGPSTPAWLAVPLAVLLLWRLPGRLRLMVVALAGACAVSVLLITAVALPFWQTFGRLTLLQFPWRFAGPLCLATALLLALLLTLIPPRLRIVPAVICVALAMVPALAYWRPNPIAVPADAIRWPVQIRRELIGGYGTTGSGLFLPRWVPGQSPAVPVLPKPADSATDVRLISLAGRADRFTADYVAGQPFTMTFGTWYFPGWNVAIDGRSVAAAPDAAGLLTVALPAGAHRLTVGRGLTGSELAGGLVTLGAVATLPLTLAGRRRSAKLAAGAIALAGVALFGVIPPLSFSTLIGAGRTPVWSLPAAAGNGLGVQPAAWRLVRSPVWGTTPMLEVAWLANHAPAGAQKATLQVRSASGAVLAELAQGPRFGTVSAANWPAGALIFDHLPIPLPPRSAGGVCAGHVTLTLRMGGRAQPTTLGKVTLPCVAGHGPATPEVLAPHIRGLASGRLPEIRPGGTLQLDFALRVPGPTADDDVLAFQLLDRMDKPVAQVQSYGNVDLRFSTLWQAGQVIPYTLRLTLPDRLPVGVYTLSLQRFSPATGRLAPLSDPGGPAVQRLTLATVKVPPSVVAPPPLPAERFGPSIGLLLPSAGALPVIQARPGAAITAPLRWLAISAPTVDYTLFVHVLNGAGKLVAQADGPPLGGRYPTSAWSSGEVIDDPRTVQLPATLPAGRYVVEIGWYLPSTGARLPATPAVPDDSYPVMDLAVAR